MMNSSRKPVDQPKLLVAAEFFSLVRGGIARTGRLLARVAADMGVGADLLALSDPELKHGFRLTGAYGGGQQSRLRVSLLDGRRQPISFYV